jgi:hypothetical protein
MEKNKGLGLTKAQSTLNIIDQWLMFLFHVRKVMSSIEVQGQFILTGDFRQLYCCKIA